MPSGHTHDCITLCSLPFVTVLAGALTQNAVVAMAVGGGFLFAGLMFSGDLDTRSHQYKRWLWLRWIWIPYRGLCKHRSIWSHGPIVGTLGRLLYVSVWTIGPTVAVLYCGHLYAGWSWQPTLWMHNALTWLTLPTGNSEFSNGGIVLAAVVGLELGAMSHSASDWTGSAFKRWRSR